MKTRMLAKCALIAATATTLGVLCGTSSAAVISWNAAQTITGDSDVSPTGPLIGALNLGASGVGNTTVNGVTFTGLALSGTDVTSGPFTFHTATVFGGLSSTSSNTPFASLSSSYQALLSTFIGTADRGSSFTLTVNGLTIGDTYSLEWWSNTTAFPNTVSTATAGNSVSLASNPSGTDGGVGQYAFGTFTADATSEVVTFSSTAQPFVNGLEVRMIRAGSAPEPGTLALLGLGLAGLAASRRRKR